MYPNRERYWSALSRLEDFPPLGLDPRDWRIWRTAEDWMNVWEGVHTTMDLYFSSFALMMPFAPLVLSAATSVSATTSDLSSSDMRRSNNSPTLLCNAANLKLPRTSSLQESYLRSVWTNELQRLHSPSKSMIGRESVCRGGGCG